MVAHINTFGEEQFIKDHLYGTAKRAEEFAEEFGCGAAGNFCGILHDIGKYSKQFQERIRNPENTKKVDHSTAGALEALHISNYNIPFSMVIAGHHSGLMDGGSYRFSGEETGTFVGRLKSKIPDYSGWEKDIKVGPAEVPPFCIKGDNRMFSMAFFIRMMYSCLVDADYLDTELFMNGGQIDRQGYPSIEDLLLRFEQYIGEWLGREEFENEKQKRLYKKRNQILEECMEKVKNGIEGYIR